MACLPYPRINTYGTAPRVIIPNLAAVGQTIGLNYGNPEENFDRSRMPPFTQGHWNQHLSISCRGYNFLSVFHSNTGISYRFRNKRRFLSKIAHFSRVFGVFNAPPRLPLSGFPLELRKLDGLENLE